MDADAIWRAKSDEQLLAAGASLSDFTEDGERIIRAELARRGLPEAPSPIGACANCGRSVYPSTPDACPQCNAPLGPALREAQLAVGRPVEPPDPAITGIGGWLILPIVGLVLGVAVGIYSVLEGVRLFPDLAEIGFGGVFALTMAIEAALVILMVVAAVYLFTRNPQAPRLMITQYVAVAASYGVVAGLFAAAGAPEVAEENGFQCVRATLVACIWVPYFRMSKRVKATFVK